VLQVFYSDADHKQGEDELEYGLIVLWEMLESQAPYLEGREADMFSLLLQIRYSSKANVSISSLAFPASDPLIGFGSNQCDPRCIDYSH
jgi:hypothetical protein